MTKLSKTVMIALLLPAVLCRAGTGVVQDRTISLRDKALVCGEIISLADVALLGEDVPAEVARLPLGNGPWPGNVRRISRVLLKIRLASAGHELKSFRFEGASLCEVGLASIRLDPEQIIKTARRYLESHFPAGGPDVQTELLNKVRPVLVRASEEPLELRAAIAGAGVPVGTVRVEVEVLRGGARLKRIPLSFLVRLYQTVAVARNQIAPGARMGPRDITFARREIGSARATCVVRLDELEGMVAASRIQPGQIVTHDLLRRAEAPVVIEPNQRVFLVVETKTLRVVTLGKSLCRARRGQIARARNLATGREVVGIAHDDSTIHVSLGGPSDDL